MGLKKLAAAALALTLCLGGCRTVTPQTPEEPTEEIPDEHVTQITDPSTYSKADSLFSINYNPAASLNPFTGTNTYNQQLFGLVYESLFELTPELSASPVLCDSFETEDGTVYYITLKDNVIFHNGARLTAEDVVYSLNTAKNSTKYSSRLEIISNVSVAEDGRVEIRLKRADYSLPSLLDTPIVPTGTAEELQPPGSGPYRLNNTTLTAFTSHREYSESIPRVIYMRQIEEADLAEAFTGRTVDLLGYDPNAGSILNIHMVHETRYYDTTDLLYLGFNCSQKVVSDLLVRRAISRLVNRAAIVEESYDNAARQSPFILSPALGLYDDMDAAGYEYSRQEFQRLSLVAGLEDVDYDGYLEYQAEDFAIRLIVNSESPSKLSAARRVATDMMNMGLNVTLEELTFSQYEAALKAGEFEIYMGEVRLRADFDMTALFSGKLNYGKISDGQYGVLMNDYLASPEETREDAAAALDMYVVEDAAIIPILYKQRLVLTHLGVVTGLAPSQSNIFAGITGWTVTLGQR